MSRPWQDVLDFWFLAPDDPGYLKTRAEWFQKNAAFDDAIRQRFGHLVEQAVAGGLQEWQSEPQGALARVLLLDQFTRNIWRDTDRAFAGDGQALALAQSMIASGADKTLSTAEAQFIYLPLMHAEDLPTQEQCVALYTDLAARDPAQANALDFAVQHRDIIARFGRFPHRNGQLGRTSTAQEIEFLTQPGSSF